MAAAGRLREVLLELKNVVLRNVSDISSSSPSVSGARSQVSSTFRRVRIGPFVASQVRQFVRFLPRLKYARILRWAAIA